MEANEYDLSHHFLVDFRVMSNPEIRQYMVVTYRNIKSVNCEVFL